MTYPGLNYQAPGVRAANESYENVVTFGDPLRANFFKFGALIDGASRDESHTGETTKLRPGLLMGYHVANKKWLPFDSGGALPADEGGEIRGILYEFINMQIDGVNTDRVRGFILMPGAPIKMSALWTNDGTPGAVVGHAAEATIRTRLETLNYLLDDWYQQ